MRLRFKENNVWNSASSGGTGKQTVFSILFRSVLKVAGLLETRACQVGLKKKKNPFTGKRANKRREEKPGKGNSIHWHAYPFLSEQPLGQPRPCPPLSGGPFLTPGQANRVQNCPRSWCLSGDTWVGRVLPEPTARPQFSAHLNSTLWRTFWYPGPQHPSHPLTIA